MRDSEFPSIWAVHNEALFNPVLVRGRLITVVESAPAAWSDRLEELGFKKGSRAWLRMGATAPSEYEYISPAIVLKAFKPEDVLNTHEEFEENPVPLTVQDAIASLWQNNLDGVLFELSFLGVETRSAAWSHVEAAIQGDETPEADAVTELAFARMQKLGTLADAALEYAARKGWEGVTPEQLQVRGGIVIASGESVHWADYDGVVHTGRLAMTLRHSDVDAWVYEDGPRFVGGVAIAALSKVDRQQIQFLDAGQHWQDTTADDRETPDHSKWREPPPDISNVEVPTYFSLSGYTEETGIAVKGILADTMFPSEGWREEIQQKIFEHPEIGPLGVEIFEALERIEGDLYALSKHYYGNTGIGFCLTRHFSADEHESFIEMCLGNYNKDGFYSICDGVDGVPVLKAERLEYSEVAENLDASHRNNVQRFVRTVTALGRNAGTNAALPSEFLSGYRVSNVLNELESSGMAGAITYDQLTSILASVSGKSLLAKHIAAPSDNGAISSLELFNFPVPSDNNIVQHSKLVLSVANITQPITTLETVHRNLQGSQLESAVGVEAKYSLAIAHMQYPGTRHLELVEKVPGLSFFSSEDVIVCPLPQFEDAEQAMSAAITYLGEQALVGDKRDELEMASKKMNIFPLASRYYAAIEATKHADPAELRAWVENEVRNGFKGKANLLSADFFKQQIEYIAEEIRGNEGIVVSLETGTTRRVRRNPVPGSDASLAESREAVLGAAMVRVKERYRKKGSLVALDAIAFSDPALCALLAGERAVVEKDRVSTGNVYEDAGVVAGFAKKDIRAFSRAALIEHASRMSTEQKEKYLKRELIWPRKSFEEMRDEGMRLQTAIAVDVLWRALPKAPKSPSIKHVRSFTEFVSIMRDDITTLLGKIRSGELKDANPGETDYESSKLALNTQFKIITQGICQYDVVKETYGTADFKVRGISGMWVNGFEPFSRRSRAMSRLLSDATWAHYLKEKKVARPAAQSRVQRGVVVREGEDYRNGVSVASEDFLKTFAFSGVEYGNWTNQKEREAHLNLSYDSMMDFAKLVGWEPMALSLGGRLGLCIGSRGHGGIRAADAHFEPANYAMNLTRMSGDGSLAHEYWHAAANHFGHIHTGRPTDLLNTFGYGLQIKGPLPAITGTSLREPVRKAFRDLQVAIMRDVRPGGDVNNIEDYTELSAMMKCSLEMGEYWAEPAEMFARAMEMWVVDQMAFKGCRNDYLVRPGIGGGHYPTPEHLNRISQWVDPLLESIELEVRKVAHPLLGDIDIPILNSEHRSAVPLPPQDLVDLALTELDRLFKKAAPKVMFYAEPGAKAGFYKAAINLLALNEAHADRGVFYHEAWHACEATLLTAEERTTMREAFAANGALSAIVIDAMRAEGLSETCVTSAMNNSSEMQAYAFQLWADDKLDLSERRLSEFYRVKGFANGVVEIGDVLGAEKATAIFSQFMRGDFAERFASGLEASAGVSVHLARVPVVEEVRPNPSGLGMRL